LQNLDSLIEKFSKVKVLVVGDVMLDRYWWGSVSRISPEAPVPVVALEKTSYAAGGAANVAANIAGLGAVPYLAGITGNDAEADLLEGKLSETGISHKILIRCENRSTTVKTRIVAHSQQVARIDQETVFPIEDERADSVFDEIAPLFEEIDAVVISDYAKGFLTPDLLARLISLAGEKQKLFLVDPKGGDYTKYSGASVLTPNSREAYNACGFEKFSDATLETVGKMLIEKLRLDGLLITQGEHGMTVFDESGKTINLTASARNVYDVTGAGDTVIASLSVAMSAGLSLAEAAEFANVSAGLVVEQVGTTAITKEMLRDHEL
jgi:D-beta-D-heptose 7-phosphate kinase/D-beta-D-heptose 1-phosphate adenosyltransferase